MFMNYYLQVTLKQVGMSQYLHRAILNDLIDIMYAQQTLSLIDGIHKIAL